MNQSVLNGLCRAIFVMSLCWFATSAWGGNIVQNGNFEGPTYAGPDGDILPTGWMLKPPDGFLSRINVSSATNPATFLGPQGGDGGNYMAFQSAALHGNFDCFLQDLATTVGHTYTVSFWVAITSTSVGNTLGLDPEWDEGVFSNQATMGANQMYFHPTNTGPVDYQQFVFHETAATNLTRIDFHGSDANGAILLDNVVVTDDSPIPEPMTLLLIGSGLVVFGLCFRVAKKQGKREKLKITARNLP